MSDKTLGDNRPKVAHFNSSKDWIQLRFLYKFMNEINVLSK